MRYLQKLMAGLLVLAMLGGLLVPTAATTPYPEIKAGDVENIVIGGDLIPSFFSFRPDQDGVYAFWSYNLQEGDAYGYIENEDGEQIASSDDDGEGLNFRMVAELDSDACYTLVADSCSCASEYSIRIKYLTPATEIFFEEQDEAFVGVEQELELSTSADEYVYETVIWASKDPEIATVDQQGVVTPLAAGTATITATTASGLYAEYELVVKEVFVLTVDTSVTLSAVEEQRLAFVPEADGWYGFYSTGLAHLDTYCDLRDENDGYMDAGWDGAYMDHFLIRAWLMAGETYYLLPTCSGGEAWETYSIFAKPLEDAVSMKIFPETLTGKVGEYDDVVAVLIPFNSYAQEVTWTSSDPNVAQAEYGTVYFIGGGTATITATSEAGLTATCQITVTDYPAITGGEAVTIDPLQGSAMYKFVPETSGTYCIYSTGSGDTDPYVHLNDSRFEELGYDHDSGEGDHFLLYYEMTAGEIYYIYSNCSGYSHGDTYDLHVDLAGEPTSMVLSLETVEGYAGKTCELTAQFLPLSSLPQEITWSSTDESVAKMGEDDQLLLLSPGTATVTATTKSGLTASCTVTVLEVPELKAGEEVSVGCGNEWKRFAFVPDTDGNYCFYTIGSGSYEIGGKFLDADGKCMVEGYAFDKGLNLQCYLEAGQTYYIETNSQGEAYWSYDICVQKTVPATKLSLSKTELSGYPGDWIDLDLITEPIYADVTQIIWTSTDDSVATKEGYWDSVALVNPGTCVITASTESGLSASCTVTVKEVPAITLGEVVELDNPDSRFWFRFVAPASGEYVFFSEGGMDTHGEIMDADKNTLTSDDDSGSDWNFYATYEMEKGNVYYLSCGTYNAYEEVTYRVGIAKTTAATALELEVESINMQQYNTADAVKYSFLPQGAIIEEITWTSSDPSVVLVDEWGYLEAVGEGECVITATSESGLTDSYTVKVTGGVQRVSVSGSIESFGENTPVNLLLWQGFGEIVAEFETTLDSYQIDDVPSGSYTLEVSKENHVTRRYRIIVEEASVVQDVKICLLGDVTGDGEIDIADTGRIYAHVKGTSELTDYALACADVMDDGEIDIADTGRIYAHVKGTAELF